MKFRWVRRQFLDHPLELHDHGVVINYCDCIFVHYFSVPFSINMSRHLFKQFGLRGTAISSLIEVTRIGQNAVKLYQSQYYK